MAQRPIELILARQLASALAVPVLLVDAQGDTVFFNEPAEQIYGHRFDEIDDLPFETRTAILAPRRKDGQRLPMDELPGVIALRERRPAHDAFYMHGLDGVLRSVEATAIPLESAGGHLLGALVILWTSADHEARPSDQPTDDSTSSEGRGDGSLPEAAS